MTRTSRIPGFYRLSLEERRDRVCASGEVTVAELEEALRAGGLDADAADKVVENVLGTYGIPFGVALNFRVNGVDRLVPMVIEEPSVIAAASNAARMIREGGGFDAEHVDALMTTQIQLYQVPDPVAAVHRLLEASEELLALGAEAVPNLIRRGGGPRQLEVRDLGHDCLVVHVHVDCKDAMGANLVNSIAEAIGPRASELAGASLGLRILTNLCDRRRVRVRCRVHASDLTMSQRTADSWGPDSGFTGTAVIDGIVQASRFAELDPYRAVTHNKGIMNGVDAVVLATGNDFRAVEAGAHGYAARDGHYRPLATWRRDGDDLLGELDLPLALGTVGGTLRVHPAARLALRLTGTATAEELAQLAGAAGLASNLAALRALATEGIQRGHMSLHARSVATAAGATGDHVELVARRISAEGNITVDAAAAVLEQIKSRP